MAEGADARLPVYLVRGEDEALVATEAARLIDRLVEGVDRTSAIDTFDAAEVEAPALVSACQTPPFFGDRRIIVLRRVGQLPEPAVRALRAYLDAPLATTSVVLVSGGGATPPSLMAAARSVKGLIEAKAPAGRERDQWWRDRLGRAPVRLDAGARRLLDTHVGEDVARLDGLLQTLADAYGPTRQLTAAEVKPFLGEAGGVPPWALLDAIDAGRASVALGELQRLLATGSRHPLQLMATLERPFVLALRAHGDDRPDAALAGEWKASPYVVRAARRRADRLGWEGLRRAIELLAQADLDLRGATGVSPDVVLEVLVLRLAELRSPASAAAPPGRSSGSVGRSGARRRPDG